MLNLGRFEFFRTLFIRSSNTDGEGKDKEISGDDVQFRVAVVVETPQYEVVTHPRFRDVFELGAAFLVHLQKGL